MYQAFELIYPTLQSFRKGANIAAPALPPPSVPTHQGDALAAQGFVFVKTWAARPWSPGCMPVCCMRARQSAITGCAGWNLYVGAGIHRLPCSSAGLHQGLMNSGCSGHSVRRCLVCRICPTAGMEQYAMLRSWLSLFASLTRSGITVLSAHMMLALKQSSPAGQGGCPTGTWSSLTDLKPAGIAASEPNLQ